MITIYTFCIKEICSDTHYKAIFQAKLIGKVVYLFHEAIWLVFYKESNPS